MHKISVMSGKGGVGKTTACLGTALALSSEGFSTGILDLDLENPSLGVACGFTRADLGFGGEYITPPRWHGIPIMSLSLLPLTEFRDTPTLVNEERKHELIRHLFSEVDWGELDFLLIDMPPGSGEEVRGLLELQPDGIVIVTSPQELSEAAVRRVVVMAEEYSLRIVGVLQNDVNRAKGNAAKNVGKQFGLTLLGDIPWDDKISAAMEAHESIDHLPFLRVAKGIIEACAPATDSATFQEMTDDEWVRAEKVLPPQGPGRQRSDDRMVVNGILYVVRTMTPWAKLPEKYGPWQTVWNRYDAWRKSDTWAVIEAALAAGPEDMEGANVDGTASSADGETGAEGVLREGGGPGESEESGSEGAGTIPGCGDAVGSHAHSEAAPGSEDHT